MKIAVVTGASSGIGAEICKALKARGWHVVGLSRSAAPEADEHEPCDVADRAAIETAAERVRARHPEITLLVNNAGIPARNSYLDAEPELIESVMRTNYLGSVWCLRALLPALGPGSHLVNIVSVAGLVAVGPYSASKHAQLAFSRSVAVELAPRGVSVHTINPGFIETPGFPQRSRFGPILGRLAPGPAFVAERVMGAIEHDRREIILPRWYRVPAWAQALAPGTFARLQGLRRKTS